MSARDLLARTRASNPLPSGTMTVGVGLMVAGVTSYAFLLLTAHAVGAEQYATFFVVWSLIFLGGPGFFLPLEQEVSRALSQRSALGQGSGPLLRRAASLGAVLAAGLVVVSLIGAPVALDQLFHGQVLLVVALVGGWLGYYAEHLSRGTLSGLGRFRNYSVLLGAEGVARLAACIVLLAVGASSAGPYGLAVGFAPFVGVAVAMRGQRDLTGPGPDAPVSELSTALGWLLLGSVMAQCLMNGGPIAAQLLASDAERSLVGEFAGGVVLARIPLFLFQAIQAALLPRLSALAGSGRLTEFRRGFRRLLVAVASLGVVGTLAAATIGPWALGFLFRGEFDLSHRTLGLLAAGSALFMLAMAMAQAAIALGGHARMAVAWVAAVVTFVMTTILGDDLLLRVELGLLFGSAVGAGGMALVVFSRIREGAVVQAGDFLEALHEVPFET
ncbi:MAG: lipopolysaccharide biosynthesis protein [Acidimicrobiales bacterium]